MCGSSVLAAAPQAKAWTPSLTPRAEDPHGFSKWLVAVAISLIAAPAFRLYSIVCRQAPELLGEQHGYILARNPGFADLLLFEMIANVLLIAGALVLNYLFYTKSRHFTKWMVAYASTTFLYLVAVSSATHTLLPTVNSIIVFTSLVESLLWVGPLIAFLLLSPDVKSRFTR